MSDKRTHHQIDEGLICEARHGLTPEQRETLHICVCEFATHTFCELWINRTLPYLRPDHYGLQGAVWCQECHEKHEERMR